MGQSGLQLPFPGPYQVGMNLVLTGQLTDRFAAFKRFQGNPELIGAVCRRRVLAIILSLHMLSNCPHSNRFG